MIDKSFFIPFVKYARGVKAEGIYPYFRPIGSSMGTEVEVDGKRLIMLCSNDYLGLTHHPKVQEYAIAALRKWGTATGGSRFLSGNLLIHEILEERLAHFLGKKACILHVTGFSANMGGLSTLLRAKDIVVCDREDHASIFEGCKASGAKIVPYPHNFPEKAISRIKRTIKDLPDASILLVTEGIFSMSGDVVDLHGILKIKKEFPELSIYLDDAHGIGVMGDHGKGTANYFNVTDKIDFIMGTFSKSFASIGGFIASDDLDIMEYLRHHSRTFIFSAALPAVNTATALAALDIMEKEPERIALLWKMAKRAYKGFKEIGLHLRPFQSPIIPILIGKDEDAFSFSTDLFKKGIFALPAIYPAVPKGKAVIRTAYMSTHKNSQIDYVIEVFEKLAKKYGLLNKT